MKKIPVLFILFFSIAIAYAQDFQISFAGSGVYTTVDSVKVENRTQGTKLSLKGADILRLKGTVGISNLNSNQQNAKIVPTPMQGRADLIFYAEKSGEVHIQIFDITGKKVLQTYDLLENGTHKYELTGFKEGSYIVNVIGDNFQYNVKLINNNNIQNHPAIKYIGKESSQFMQFKLDDTRSTITMNYKTGDSLRFTGYSGVCMDIVEDVPSSNKTITFTFKAILPILSTTAITGISDTTATSGGNITSDGAATVTARGVCWGTSVNPELSGKHTTDGTGTGIFNSNIIGLTSNTTYYVRAYATNSTGTAYGNELSFTTKGKPTVVTIAATAKTDSSAISGGNVTNDGGYTVTARGVCWSTTPNPDISGPHSTDGAGTGIFTSNLHGLITHTLYFIRAYATNSSGIAYGSQLSFKTADSTFHCGISTVNDIEGNIYNTVAIDNQCWFKQNLNTTKFDNGDDIPLVTLGYVWKDLTTPAYCNFNNDIANAAIYGRLYNWLAVNDNRKLCPVDWHVSTDHDWNVLLIYLDKTVDTTHVGWSGDKVGGKLRETGYAHWLSPNIDATNSSGFTALGGSSRGSLSGTYGEIKRYGYWWTSSEYSATEAWVHYLYYWYSDAAKGYGDKNIGNSVRCVKD